MKIGYARVSTVGQDLETQKEILTKYGCEEFFVEKTTGTTTENRKELKRAMKYMRKGDKLVVTKIDRLARSILDLNNIIKQLINEGIGVVFVNEDMEFSADTKTNSMQMLLFNMLGAFAQFERDLIVERTTEGRERAKKQGKHLGRPSQPRQNIDQALQLYKNRKNNGHSVNDIAKLTDVPRSTIYYELKKLKQNKVQEHEA